MKKPSIWICKRNLNFVFIYVCLLNSKLYITRTQDSLEPQLPNQPYPVGSDRLHATCFWSSCLYSHGPHSSPLSLYSTLLLSSSTSIPFHLSSRTHTYIQPLSQPQLNHTHIYTHVYIYYTHSVVLSWSRFTTQRKMPPWWGKKSSKIKEDQKLKQENKYSSNTIHQSLSRASIDNKNRIFKDSKPRSFDDACLNKGSPRITREINNNHNGGSGSSGFSGFDSDQKAHPLPRPCMSLLGVDQTAGLGSGSASVSSVSSSGSSDDHTQFGIFRLVILFSFICVCICACMYMFVVFSTFWCWVDL